MDGDGPGRFVEDLAAKQLAVYRLLPQELRAHHNREQAALDAYRGRQILELLQNSDDSGEEAAGECTLRLELSRERLVVANQGKPFSNAGLGSLVISDCSPKQDRNRFIGCKGLGFRSVLTWTDRPLVSSGPHVIAFDRARAISAAEGLCRELSSVPEEILEFQRINGSYPAAVMRFPNTPTGSEEADLAAVLREKGYDTVVVLPLPAGEQGDKVHADIVAQLESLGERSLLFCRHLTRVDIAGDVTRAWTLLRESRGDLLQDVVLSRDGEAYLWTVHRSPPGRVKVALDQGERTQQAEYELAIAVPQTPSCDPNATLCVFFPTREKVPCSLALHATLETTDDRNHLVDTSTNREVLHHLANLVADVLASEGRRALALLTGLDQSHGPLDFVDILLKECETRRIFPRVDGALEVLSQVRRAPQRAWRFEQLAQVLPEMLDEDSLDARTRLLLDRFQWPWFDRGTLKARLQSLVESLSPEMAGETIGRLLIAHQLSGIGVNDLIIAADGGRLQNRGHAFFPPAAVLPSLPAFATSVRFVHPSFHVGLARGTAIDVTRTLSAEITLAGGRIDEYRFDTVVKALIEEASRPSDDAAARWCEVLAWLYAASCAGAQLTSDLRVRAMTTAGKLALASECYFGPTYRQGQLISRLYAPFKTAELIAEPSALGLPSTPEARESVERFLTALGVAARPRSQELSWLERRGIVNAVIARLDYPRTFRDQSVEDAAALRVLCREYDIPHLCAPDRIRALIAKGETLALIEYLLSPDGVAALAEENDTSTAFVAKFAREHIPRVDHAIAIPNATLFFLREDPWVPASDGKKHRPREIVLGRHLGDVLKGLYQRHTIDGATPERRDAVERLLMRLGAVASLERFDGDALYGLLLSLPVRDPSGGAAQRLYTALVEAQVEVGDSSAKQGFFDQGKMWGRYRGKEGYFEVKKLRYNVNLTLPALIESYIGLLALPSRRDRKQVERLFGVSVLIPSDIHLAIDPAGTSYEEGSEVANAHLRKAIVFLYALRIPTTTEHARDAKLLESARLNVCSRARVVAKLSGIESMPIDLAAGERIVVDDDLLIVAEYPEPGDIRGWIRFWQSVGLLVSDRMGPGYAAGQVGNVLRCHDDEEMEEVVRALLGPDGDSALDKARSRFSAPPEPAAASRAIPLPAMRERPPEPPEKPVDEPARSGGPGVAGPVAPAAPLNKLGVDRS